MKRGPGEHGTVTRYRQYAKGEQRCEACRAAYSDYNRANHALKMKYSERRQIPGDAVKKHIDRLVRLGLSGESIARRADVAATTVRRIQAGHKTRVHIARRIMAVTADNVSRGPVIGTRRRIQALRRIGWPCSAIAKAGGIDLATVKELSREDCRATTTRRYIDAVAVAYDRLSMQLGPSVRTVTIATAHGWPPPLAWDDDKIDDPRARPAGVGQGPQVHSLDTILDAAEVIASEGGTWRHLADRLGMNVHSVKKRLQREGVMQDAPIRRRLSRNGDIEEKAA